MTASDTTIDRITFTTGRIAAVLPVRDIDVAVETFRQILGLEKVFANGDPVGFVILRGGDAELHLTLQKYHRAAAFNVAHVMVSDAAEVHRRCEKHGLRIIRRLEDKDYGLRAFVFADRDGNRIDVGEPLDVDRS